MSYETVTVVGTLLAVVLAVVISNWAMLRGFRSEVRGDIAGLRTELKADISELRTELKGDIAAGAKETASLRAELKADISELRTELKADISELRTELKADMAAAANETTSLRAELVGLNQRIDATNSRIDRLTDSLMAPRHVPA